jgi:hypothetical protein
VFVRSDDEVLVAAWLRSSQREEVSQQTGMLRDQRREIVSIGLPCARPKLLGYYDPQGHRKRNSARLHSGSLDRVRLKGDRVFIAELSCAAKPESPH